MYDPNEKDESKATEEVKQDPGPDAGANAQAIPEPQTEGSGALVN